ncbi:hypothetical protein [Paenibacillus lentus]|uniref:DUF1795 domain-containing protein n=1 Tax=Paenibacillus lentus TaxID=1338368 RepID=A0A3Q8S3S3_9BACL|nr:hypothetical protein [Paenibacillus lentus]AZK45389.1 hypothetical protein EIM92_03525 [Paenibacillus lentus]
MYYKLITLAASFILLVGCSSSPAATNNISNSNLTASEKPIPLDSAKEMSTGVQDEHVAIPGTSLSFVPSAEFQLAGGFVGYESVKHQTSIMVIELPVPDGTQAVHYFDNLFTADRLQTKGLELLSKEKIHTEASHQALLIKCHLISDGVTYVQWIYILGSKGQTAAQIQVTAPEENFILIEDQITDMLASFQWTEESSEANLYYSLDLPTDWKLAKQHGTMELYNKDGVFPVPAGEPLLSVLNLQQTVSAEDRQAFLDKMNLQRNYYSNLEVIHSEDVEIDGYPANISYVSGIETQSANAVIKQYCYIFIDQTIILIEADQLDQLNKADFEKIARSWKLK